MAIMDAKQFFDGLNIAWPYLPYYLIAVLAMLASVGFLPKTKPDYKKFRLYARAFMIGLVVYALGVTGRLTCPFLQIGNDVLAPSALLIFFCEFCVASLICTLLIKALLPFSWKNAFVAGLVTGFATVLAMTLALFFSM